MFRLFKEQHQRNKLRTEVVEKVESALRETIPWPAGWTLPGPEALDRRVKSPGQVHEAYVAAIERDRILYEESIATQEDYVKQLRGAARRTIRPFKRIGMMRELRTARGQLRRSRELKAVWETTLDYTEKRLEVAFRQIEADISAGEFSIKKYQQLYIRELQAAVKEYYQAKHMVGASIIGTPYLRRNAKQDARYGIGLMPEFQAALERGKTRMERVGLLAGHLERADATRVARAEKWLARVAAAEEQESRREPAGARA